MYLGFYCFYRQFNANRMFTDPSSPIGDDLAYPLVYLGQRLTALGHQVATLDTDDLEKFDAAVFLDHPTVLNPYLRKLCRMPEKKLYLILAENPALRPDNYWRRNHRVFDKVFTWNPEWVDGKKYFQLRLPNKIPVPFAIERTEKTKFCVTIASQKYVNHPRELYSERVRAIRWFEREHPEEFDLYGTNGDRRWFTGRLARLNLLLQRFYAQFPDVFPARAFPSHRGRVPGKNPVLRQYKFALAYENAVFPGYVSEKIFDAFFAGCVPIYLGAPDVTDLIPAEAFIDRRRFGDHEQLYHFMKNMSEAEYAHRLSVIQSFVAGQKIRPFSAEGFAETLIKQIVEPNLIG
jgi:hypothetical protein